MASQRPPDQASAPVRQARQRGAVRPRPLPTGADGPRAGRPEGEAIMSRPRDHRRKAWHCRTCGVETAFAGFDKCGQCVEDEKLTEAGDSIDPATAAIQRLNEAER